MNLTRLSFAVMFLLVLSMPAQLNYNSNSSSAQVQNDTISQNYTQPAPVHVSQPLVPVTGTTTRSFSSTAGLHGNSDTITQQISWYQNGTVSLSDTMGDNLNMDIPVQGGTLAILQNDTTVDQRFAGTGLQYDIYWKAVAGPDGSIEKYKVTITGTSTNGFAMNLPLKTTQHLVQDGNRFLAVPASTLDNSTALEGGIGLDWSDAVSSGYAVSLGANNTITLNLGKSFSVDPTTVDTVTVRISPQSSDYYEGEKRVLKVGITTFAFYYDNSNIVYQYSTDGGNSWGGKISAGTGTVASDTYRWTVATATINGTSYIDLLYYQVSGSNTNFYSKTGTVTGTNISWGVAKQIFQKVSTDPKAAAVAATDTKNEIFAAFRYYTGTAFLHQIWKSTDAGNTWTNTTITASSNSGYRTVMTLAPLASGKMLFAYTSYDHTEFNYTVYGGSSWGAAQTTSGSGLATNTFKQISSDSNSAQPYLAYVVGGNSSTLKVARWNSDGTFNTFETANTLSNSLPSITVTPDGTVHVYTISGGKVYDTRKIGSTWKAPSNPFGITFTSPNHLSSGISYAGALWEETASPFNVRFGSLTDSAQFVASTSYTLSPSVTDYYEGERRVVSVNGTIFAFYYNGTNIVYNYTTDNGASWSSSVSANAGAMASDSYRWSVAATNSTGTNYVMLLYYQVSGTNTNFYSKTGNVTGTSITWGAAHTIFSRSTTDPKAAAVAAADTNGNIFAAFRYYTGLAFLHQIWKWSVSGHTWANTTSTTTANSGYRTVMTLAPLASGKMLFAYASYDHTDFTYQVYDGTSWGSAVSTTNAKMTTNTFKQISSGSDGNHTAYLAYVLGGNSSSLVVGRWNSDGTFNKFEATQNNMTNSLPSITFTPDGIIRIYTISGGKVWETDKVNSYYWTAAKNPFGTTFTSPNYLTTAISSATALWAENSAAPYNVMFGTNRIGWTSNTGILEPLYSDPYNFSNTCHTASCFNWNKINNTKNAYPHVPFFVVANPSSGPGNNVIPRYQQGIVNLTKSGVIVLGYVWSWPGPSCCNSQTEAEVKGNIDKWVNWYSAKNSTMVNLGIKGIFLDGFPNDQDGNETFYSDITSYIHDNLTYSLANPGADVFQGTKYHGTVDLLNIVEANKTLPTNHTLQGNAYSSNPPNWHTLYDKNTFSWIVYCQSNLVNRTYIQGTSVYVGLLYPLDQHGCSPSDSGAWSIIPPQSWLNTTAAYISKQSVLSTIQAIDKSSGNSIHITTMTILQNNNLVRNATAPFAYNETSGWPFNFTAPATNSTYHFCYWTYPGTNTTNRIIQVAPTASNTYTATYSPTC